MRKRRVLILSHLFPNKTFPYEGTYVRDLLPHLKAAGWTPEVAVLRDLLPTSRHVANSEGVRHLVRRLVDSHRLQSNPNGIGVHHYPFFRLPRLHKNYDYWKRWLGWQMLPRLKHLYERDPFDVVIGYGMMPDGALAVDLGRELGLPALCYSIGSDLHSIHAGTRNRDVVASTLRDATMTITVSRDLKERARTLCPEACVASLPVGVDVDYFHPDVQPIDLGPGHHVSFMTVFKPVKAPLLGLEAFRRLHSRRGDVTLHITGDGPLLPEAEAFVEDNGLQQAVQFYGLVDSDHVPRLLRSVDVAMLTSHKEGTPRIVLEAMSVGSPIVATEVGGVPDLLPPSLTALAVPPDDPEALSRALGRALERDWDGEVLREQAEEFSWPRIGQKLACLLEEAYGHYRRSTK